MLSGSCCEDVRGAEYTFLVLNTEVLNYNINQEEMEARKEGLYQMWKCRGRKLREIMQKAP